MCVNVCVCVLGVGGCYRKLGHASVKKADEKKKKKNRPVGNPTITLNFIVEIERGRYWE